MAQIFEPARGAFLCLPQFFGADLTLLGFYCGVWFDCAGLNLVITGNPGTGKTMFSRLQYRFMRAYGILKSDHEIFIERNGLELKGQFLGDTAPKVKRAVREALGGCLFIDEAYALAEGGGLAEGGDSFAKDAIRTLLTEVEVRLCSTHCSQLTVLNSLF